MRCGVDVDVQAAGVSSWIRLQPAAAMEHDFELTYIFMVPLDGVDQSEALLGSQIRRCRVAGGGCGV